MYKAMNPALTIKQQSDTDLELDKYYAERRARQLKALKIAMDTLLTPRQRYVYTAIKIQGRTQTDVANELGVYKSTICRTYKRAEKKINLMVNCF